MQKWNLEKMSEAFLKVWFKRRSRTKISAVEPQFYAERFINFIRSHVFIESFDKLTLSKI